MSNTYSFSVACHCGCVGGDNMIQVANANLAEWQHQLTLGNIGKICCIVCGCDHIIVDGGTELSGQLCCSPRVDYITVNSGPSAGGTTVGIVGHCLNVGTLAVKFGDILGIVQYANENYAEVKTPVWPNPPQFVNVSVENGNGQRVKGGSLTSAFLFD